MTITIDATYEDGVLKPAQPLPLAEHEKVGNGGGACRANG
jgi:predicted DNA-binding antitoxin AbrB/MazE fold protein